MPLVKSGVIAADRFARVADDAPTPGDGAVLLSADRFLAEAADLAQRLDEIGVIWPNHRDIEDIEPHLPRLACVALAFPNFRDGRAYSQARILRERFGYRGELRATGQILRDQFVFLRRAGFDSLEVRKEADAVAYRSVMQRYSVFYQPAGDGGTTVFRQRLHRHRDDVRTAAAPAGGR